MTPRTMITMITMIGARLRATSVVVGLLPLAVCSEEAWDPGKIEFEPDRPQPSTPESDPAPYTGADPIVLEAQATLPTGLDLHQKVIHRTCTPNGGVCHNSKEFPDLRTPANFAAAFGANCNIQYGEYQSVFDRCERPGDRVRIDAYGIGDRDAELGWVEVIVGDPYQGEELPPDNAPGLHVHFGDPLPGDGTNTYGTAEFARSFVVDGEVRKVVYATYSARWWIMPGRKHAIGEVREYQVDQVANLLAGGIVGGDPNRNDVFGARESDPVHLLEPGDPENSYLIARLRGIMLGVEIPGSRMPLANQPFSVPEMLALFCFVEGFPDGGSESDLVGRIDYAGCSYSSDPASLNLLGEGVTWQARISKILEFNCGGCHNEVTLQAGLNLVGDGVYDRLLEPSSQRPELDLIQPNEPQSSYLYLKLTSKRGDDAIVGNPMPYNPLTGKGSLTDAEKADILTWITNGAVENE